MLQSATSKLASQQSAFAAERKELTQQNVSAAATKQAHATEMAEIQAELEVATKKAEEEREMQSRRLAAAQQELEDLASKNKKNRAFSRSELEAKVRLPDEKIVDCFSALVTLSHQFSH